MARLSPTSSKSRDKKSRVDEEKSRQYRLLTERTQRRDAQSEERSSIESEEVSDEGENMKSIRKKMSRKQRDQCSSRVSSCLRKAGTSFPEDTFETTESSGTDTVSSSAGTGSVKSSVKGACSHSHSKKVKSGAEVQKRLFTF